MTNEKFKPEQEKKLQMELGDLLMDRETYSAHLNKINKRIKEIKGILHIRVPAIRRSRGK